MNFDLLMERYDNLVRENALLRAEGKTLQQKVESQQQIISDLRAQVATERLKAQFGKPETDPFLQVAREAVSLYGVDPNQKIAMIKEVRTRMGYGLKEAKDAVEQVLREYGK